MRPHLDECVAALLHEHLLEARDISERKGLQVRDGSRSTSQRLAPLSRSRLESLRSSPRGLESRKLPVSIACLASPTSILSAMHWRCSHPSIQQFTGGALTLSSVVSFSSALGAPLVSSTTSNWAKRGKRGELKLEAVRQGE